ncbi:orotidine 5'-phosphate decarboxylase [Nocardia sp. NBC_01730]|uniref:orotidine 5'-phosphate decarboxylase / HUMPS family protein n=1 Tax=Nocardia sp. NBC_01730 TaxID=2975998 RepID=UPI002E123164|nr:orotidine 5'-phosphate decarboxylase [Nocardia sp. NBC_01730]
MTSPFLGSYIDVWRADPTGADLRGEPLKSPCFRQRRSWCTTQAAAVAADCGGVVCAASDLSVIRKAAPDILTVVPGIRPAGGAVHDQQRVATPAEAIRSGASILVLGRAITAATDPAEAAQAIAEKVAQAL